MWKQLGIFFLSILFNITLLPVLIIILTPIFIYRVLVKKSAEWFAPNLEKILDPVSALVAGGGSDVYKNQVSSGIIAVTLSGRIDIDQIADSFQEKVINCRFPNGQLRHPQLQQFIQRWMGFLFWETEKDFDVRTHVEVWSLENSTVVTQETFKNIINTILKKEFVKEQSPWKLYIVNNTRISSDPPGVGNKTSLILHFHHVLGGGVEVMNERILQSWFDSNSNETVEDETGNCQNESKTKFHCYKSMNWRLILKYTKVLMFGSYEFLSNLINQPERIDWNSKTNGEKWQGDLVLNISEPLPTTVIKDIRSIYGTSFVSIILGAYAGALRRFMIQHLIKPPSEIKCSIQMQPDGNDSNPNLIVNLPIGNPDLDPPSPKERIQIIQNRLQRASKSTVPAMNSLWEFALGMLPNYAVRKMTEWRFAKYVGTGTGTSLISVSSPLEKQILCNSEVVALLPVERSPPSLQGPTLLCYSYGGSVQCILFGDSSILPRSSLPLKDLNTFIFKELNDLIRLDSVLYV